MLAAVLRGDEAGLLCMPVDLHQHQLYNANVLHLPSVRLNAGRGPGAPRQARISSSPLQQPTWLGCWGCWGCSARGLQLLRVVEACHNKFSVKEPLCWPCCACDCC